MFPLKFMQLLLSFLAILQLKEPLLSDDLHFTTPCPHSKKPSNGLTSTLKLRTQTMTSSPSHPAGALSTAVSALWGENQLQSKHSDLLTASCVPAKGMIACSQPLAVEAGLEVGYLSFLHAESIGSFVGQEDDRLSLHYQCRILLNIASGRVHSNRTLSTSFTNVFTLCLCYRRSSEKAEMPLMPQ